MTAVWSQTGGVRGDREASWEADAGESEANFDS
jgi:hypothetical protein